MGTATYGLYQQVGSLAHHDENGLRGWFLNEFEYFVSTLNVHAFGQPDDRHLITALTRLHAEFPYQQVALAGSDDCLLILCSHGSKPVVECEIGSAEDQLMPGLGEVVAHRLVVARH